MLIELAKHYFWVCLWGCFWKKFALEWVGWVKKLTSPVWETISQSLRARITERQKRQICSLCLSWNIHRLLPMGTSASGSWALRLNQGLYHLAPIFVISSSLDWNCSTNYRECPNLQPYMCCCSVSLTNSNIAIL